jgi:dienelactone hydrolase
VSWGRPAIGKGLRFLAVLMAAVLAGSPAAASASSGKTKKKSSKKTPEPPPVPRPPDPNRVTLVTADGVVLAGTYRPLPDRPAAPAVLLVHDFSRERRVWDALAPELAARGLATLAVDLRGHGESTRKAAGGTVKLSPRLLSDSGAFPEDVRAACRWLRERSPRVGVLGLSLGGNLAILATDTGAGDAAVSISASAQRLSALSGGRPIHPRSLLMLASRDDTDRAESVNAVLASATDPKKGLVVPGSAHNLDLLNEPTARREALDWLAERLGASAPPPPGPAAGASN